MLTKTEAEARVAKGAAHLDMVRPGWFNQIDIGTLTLHDPCGCIVGQLCGLRGGWLAAGETFLGGIRQLFTTVHHGESCGVLMEADIGESDDDYALLQDAWIIAIAARRHPISEPVVEAESTVVCLDEGRL